MKKILLLLIICGFMFNTSAYDKKSLVERFTNASCVPCAQINNAWYNNISQQLVNEGSISHLVYNGWWPGAGDPMYLLNLADNTSRINYYGVNAVPWIEVNGATISVSQSALISTVNNGNSQFSPFKIVITQGTVSNNLIEVGVKIIRDPSDVTTFTNTKLKVALTEKTIDFGTPPGGNGETEFYSICRKMLPNAGGTTFTAPAPGDSIMIVLQYVPTTAFLQAVIMDSLRVVAFIQNDNTSQIYQSGMQDINQNYMATISTADEYYFGASSETAVYSAYIKNIGLFPDTYNINLDFDGPAGWSLTFSTVNGTFNYGQTDAVSLNPGDSTEVLANVNGNSINGYGKTTVQFVSNQGSFGNVDFRFTTFGLNVLVVDDDGGENYQSYFEQELASMSADFGVVPSDYLIEALSSLNTFDIFLWNTGVTEPGLNVEEINALQTFLDNGGALYLNGVDIAYQLADPSSPYHTTGTMEFFTNYLHSNYVLREHTASITQGIVGDPITDGLGMVTLVGGSGANTINHSQGHYANQISAQGNYSANIFSFWLKPNEHPGIRSYHSTSGKVIFTTFGFETIALAEKRTLLAENIIEWLNNPVSVEGGETDLLPASFELFQNYPNPFNPVTFIKYQVPAPSNVSIKVYDVIGREVSVLVDEVKEQGTYQVSFDSKNLASGIYFYEMIAGDFSSVKKMNLLK